MWYVKRRVKPRDEASERESRPREEANDTKREKDDVFERRRREDGRGGDAADEAEVQVASERNHGRGGERQREA